eukprot:TRINITY_DN436_c3_g1_i1.p1 TRINITY_DN436_c3_g1~~TRINITY_DN436_c3_g1_i1.p1  ORF type:complete len:774 (-),score=168.09 TRINITY_DN436_c3_g1_i1:399-2720(-)
MGTNSSDEVMISGGDEAECSETTVEIKIKTLDSQTYTLRVNKRMPVPALKEQIATVTGVLSEQQRLICRGKVLKDDQLLSAYHVEDGHTLHMVVRQPLQSSLPSATGLMGSDSTPDQPVDPVSRTARRGNQVGHSVLLGTFNIADQGDGAMPDLSRIVSAVLGSIGLNNIGTGSEGADLREDGQERLDRTSGATGMPDLTQLQPDQATLRAQFDPVNGAFRFPTAVSLGSLHPTVIPDSLTTLSQYISCMRQEFSSNGRDHSNNARATGMHGIEEREHVGGSRSGDGQGGLPTPATLAEVILSTRQMLIEQAGGCLSQLASQLEDQANVTDSLVRATIQSSAMRSGVLLQNLGALLLELGRATMTVRMGRTSSEAVVNAGPAVFISTSGPNPIMVQPLPFQPGTSFGAFPMGNVHPGLGLSGGTFGSGLFPRNIDIRIRTGTSVATANSNLGEQADAQQPAGQTDPARGSGGANLSHQSVSGVSGSPSFSGESGVRVVPIRTVVAAVPAGVSRPPSDSSGSAVGLFYPLLARVQHLNPGHLNDTRGSQASNEHHHRGLETDRQPSPESSVQQQNFGLNNGAAMRDGNPQTLDLFSTNLASVVSEITASGNNTFSQQQQGSSRSPNSSWQEPLGSSSSNTQANDGQQNGQESAAQMPSRFDQLLRTIFPGEEIRVSGVHFNGSGMDSAAEQMATSPNGEARETQRVGTDRGTFFSNLVRQIMPFISPTSETIEPRIASDSSAPQAERESQVEVETSHRRSDPPSPPSSKRQRRE